MRVYPIFCPSCDALILDAPACHACGWARPDDTAAVGEEVGAGIDLPLNPIAGSRPAAVLQHVWVTGTHGGTGRLLGTNPDAGDLRIHDLPDAHLAQDLCSTAGLVFAGCGDPATAPLQGKVFLALDGQSGQVAWRETHLEAYLLSPAACSDQTVAYLTDAGELWYREPATGAPQQTVRVEGGAVRYAPVFAGDLTLVTGQAWTVDQPALVALQRQTAAVAWRLPAKDPLVSAPVAGSKRVCLSYADGLGCVDLESGNALWPSHFTPLRRTRRGALTCGPAIAAGHVLVGGGDWADGAPAYALYAIDLASGTSVWSHRLSARMSLPPVAMGSTVIYADSAGAVVALDIASGRLIWTMHLRGRPATAPVIVQDYVYVVDEGGRLARIRYRERTSPPSEPPEAYGARQAWEGAAAAYALRGQLAEAGRCLLEARDGRHALRLFEAAGDQAGRARALTMLGEWDEAILVYETTGQPIQAAEVMLCAGRPADAARAFEALGESSRAGAAFEQAGQLIDAARCYLADDGQAALHILVQRADADASLAEWLSHTAHWELASDLLIRLNLKPAAARLLQDRERLRGAFDLWWDSQAWDQCRALAQRLSDRGAEARVCVEQRQYGEAARLYAELNEWEKALKYYDLAPSLDGSVSALSGLGRFEEAADRLTRAQRHADAGRFYQRAAEQAIGGHAYDRAAAAQLMRKAAESYAFGREKADAQACHLAAAKVLSEPILHLTDVRISSTLTVGHESRLQVMVANQGFGPARKVQVALDGRGFGYEGPTSAGNRIDVLADGDIATVQAGLTPVIPGAGVELRLRLTYETLGAETQAVGPFQAFLAVQQATGAGPTSIHIGSFEYIGPGGMHAQDVVMVRPTYDVAGRGGSAARDEGPALHSDQLARGLIQNTLSEGARFCARCGHRLMLGQSQCPNPDCAAPLCVHCGACLDAPGQDCPKCSMELKNL